MKYIAYLVYNFLKKSGLIATLAILAAFSYSAHKITAQGFPGLASSTSGAGLLGGFGGAGMPDLQVSDDEMKSFYNYLQNLDEKDWEEIERMSKQMLSDMGFDPETLQPISTSPAENPALFEPSPLPSSSLGREPQKELDAASLASSNYTPSSRISSEQLDTLLANIIDHLIVLRAKLSLAGATAEPLRRWLPDLGDLIYFLKVINKPKHHQRLIATEYENIRTALETFYKALAIYEPLITTQEHTTTLLDEPYEILGLNPQASQKEIDEAYRRLHQEQSPESMEKQLTPDISPLTKEKLLKEAALNFGFITDAYERIKAPESRVLIENERQALQQAEHNTHAANQRAINALAKSFTTLLQQEQLVKQLEQFLKKYEPLQLEERKRQEQAVAERIKEQEALARPRLSRKPLTLGQQRDWYGGYQPSYRGMDYPGLRGGYAPSLAAPTSTTDSSATSGGLAGKSGSAGKKSFSGKPGTKAANKSKDKEQDKDSKDKNKLDAANLLKKQPNKNAAQKPGPMSPEQAADAQKNSLNPFEKFAYTIDDLDKSISTFNTKFDKGAKDIFKQLQENPVPAEEFVPFVQKFKEETGLEDIKSNVSQVKKAFNAADERAKKQYTTLWDKSGVKNKTKEFKKNINQTHKTIQTHSSSYQSAQEPILEPDSPKTAIILERLGEAERLVDTIAKDVEAIEKIVKPKDPLAAQTIPKTSSKKTLII